MIRFLIAIPLIMHGLANLSGALAFAGKTIPGFTSQPSILFPKYKLNSGVGRLWGLVWLWSALLLVAAGLAAIFQRESWLPLSIIGSAFSFTAIVIWWNTVPPGARFGAIFDLFALGILLSPISDQLMTNILGA